MDRVKCKALKEELAEQPEPQLVSVERFFDGNDDRGSIGCNLMEHPGVDMFRDVLVGLLRRPDVEAVYVQIAELDPGDHGWPFTDTIFVVGSIKADQLLAAVSALEPDEVAPAEEFGVSPAVLERRGAAVFCVWWD